MSTDKILHNTSIMLFAGQGNYTEVHVTESGSISFHVEDGQDAAEPTFTLAEAKQLMAALERQIWIAENELDDYKN